MSMPSTSLDGPPCGIQGSRLQSLAAQAAGLFFASSEGDGGRWQTGEDDEGRGRDGHHCDWAYVPCDLLSATLH